MNKLRAQFVLSFVGTLLLATCGDGSKSGGFKMCAPATSTCTTAQTNAYTTCVQNACGGQYAECLGPKYKSGTFAGVCGSYTTCQNACACNDSNCAIACGLPSAECQSCLLSFATCTGTCTAPACFSGGTGTGGSTGTGTGGSTGTGTGGSTGGGATCADLLACCSAAVDATFRMACMQQYAAVMAAGDAACGQVLAVAKPTYCP